MASKRLTRILSRAALVPGMVILFQGVLHAEPSAAQKETARSLMAEGRDLREQHDLKGAMARFEAAHAIMGVPTTGFELAKSQADLALLVEARSTIRRILATPAEAGEPAPFQEARSKAEALDAELEGRIASLHFVLDSVEPGALTRLTVDGEPVATGAVAMPYRVNPGSHRVEASTAHSKAAREVQIAEHEMVDVPLEFEALPESVADAPPASPSVSNDSAVPLPVYVAGGVAAAGVIIGSVTGLLALSKKKDATAGCRDEECPPSTWADLDSAHSLATVSTVGFIVAGVSIGVGVGSWLFGRSSPTPASVQAHVSLAHGVSSLNLTGRF